MLEAGETDSSVRIRWIYLSLPVLYLFTISWHPLTQYFAKSHLLHGSILVIIRCVQPDCGHSGINTRWTSRSCWDLYRPTPSAIPNFEDARPFQA